MQTLKTLLIMILIIYSSSIFANEDKDIFIVNHGWHSGIILKTKDINNSVLQVGSVLKKHQYIEVGWGDEAFYKNSNPSVWMTLKAGLIPTSKIGRASCRERV